MRIRLYKQYCCQRSILFCVFFRSFFIFSLTYNSFKILCFWLFLGKGKAAMLICAADSIILMFLFSFYFFVLFYCWLASCSCGRHKGQAKISRRGRRRLRCRLFQAAKPAVLHADGFGQMHVYYTARAGNPLKKMQPLTVTACKVLRVIYTILKTGTAYGPQKMLKDTKRPEAAQEQPAA